MPCLNRSTWNIYSFGSAVDSSASRGHHWPTEKPLSSSNVSVSLSRHRTRHWTGHQWIPVHVSIIGAPPPVCALCSFEVLMSIVSDCFHPSVHPRSSWPSRTTDVLSGQHMTWARRCCFSALNNTHSDWLQWLLSVCLFWMFHTWQFERLRVMEWNQPNPTVNHLEMLKIALDVIALSHKTWVCSETC